MGEFAHGIYIHKEDKEQVLRMIPAIFEGSKYIPCDAGDFDRAVAVIELESWTCVYDSEHDDAFNKDVSLRTDAHCAAVDLYDGDCLQTVLWKNGRRMNTYISDPEYVELQRAKSNSGNALRWYSVTKNTDALQAVFENDIDASSKTFEFMEIMGIPNQLAIMQYDYLEEIDGMDVTYLYFRDKTPKPPVPEVPVFQWSSSGFPMSLKPEQERNEKGHYIIHIGETFTVTVSFVNIGKSGKGIRINFAGKSLEEENIIIERVQLFEGSGVATQLIDEFNLEKVVFEDGRKGYCGGLDEIEICHSITFSEYCWANHNKSKRKEFRPFKVEVFCKVLNIAEEYSAFIFVNPNENYHAGCFNKELLIHSVFKP